jgi:hypothetical protein
MRRAVSARKPQGVDEVVLHLDRQRRPALSRETEGATMTNSLGLPVIAIDYDGTWDLIPFPFKCLSDSIEVNGGTVLIVSCRADTEENREDIQEATGFANRHILLTSGSAKRWFCEQRGWQVDIWIDDEPRTVEGGR